MKIRCIAPAYPYLLMNAIYNVINFSSSEGENELVRESYSYGHYYLNDSRNTNCWWAKSRFIVVDDNDDGNYCNICRLTLTTNIVYSRCEHLVKICCECQKTKKEVYCHICKCFSKQL